MKIIIYIVIAVLLVLGIVWYVRHTKKLNLGNLVLITGAVKSGKTTMAVALSLKEYKRNYKAWKFRDNLCKLFHRENKEEMPIYYSNIPVLVKVGKKEIGYCPLTADLVLRKKRFTYNSVILISESSLFADSYDIKDTKFNDNLKVWAKLISHELHGGKCFFETQSLSDNHFAIKRNLNSYVYVNSMSKVPFLPVLRVDVRERQYTYDTGVAVDEKEIEETDKYVWISTKYWKCFDTYTYSALTDDLPVVDETKKVDTLKTYDILCVKGDKR